VPRTSAERQAAYRDRIVLEERATIGTRPDAEREAMREARGIPWWIDAAIPDSYDTLPRSVCRVINRLEKAVDQYTLGTVREMELSGRKKLHDELRAARTETAALIAGLYMQREA